MVTLIEHFSSGGSKGLSVLLAVAGATALSVRLLTWYAVYDDEGYMLVSLASYLTRGHLYSQTFSQYGPFYFWAQSIFFQLLHIPLTHDTGRLVTLLYWLASSALGAVFVYRLCKSVYLASAAGLCIMLAGLVLTNEPGHSQQIILLLYMTAACLSLSTQDKGRLFMLGCVGAALLFTKINVGVFFVAGLSQALLCALPSSPARWIGLALTLFYSAAAPWILMHSSLDQGFQNYCILATACAVVTLAFGAFSQFDHPLPWRDSLYPATGLFAGILLMIFVTYLQGMSLQTLFAGVIAAPLHHPKVFDIPLAINGHELLVALALLISLVVMRIFGSPVATSLLRCAVGVLSVCFLTLPGSLAFLPEDPLRLLVDSHVHRIQWVVALIPLALIPSSSKAENTFPRLFVSFMAVTQLLEAYPVAGSQTGIAAVPMILWAFVLIADSICGLPKLHTFVGIAILLPLAALSINLSRHSPLPPAPTKLRGSTLLHLPVEQTSQYEAISTLVRANCDMLFTMPGMGSFNMWSGIPTPNGWNLTGWMKGISLDRQAEILRIIRSDPQACAIFSQEIVFFWDQDQAGVAALPLAHYVITSMRPVAKFGRYEIRVHPQRQSAWLDKSREGIWRARRGSNPRPNDSKSFTLSN